MRGWEIDKLNDNAHMALKKGHGNGGVVDYELLSDGEYQAKLVLRSGDATAQEMQARFVKFATDVLERDLRPEEVAVMDITVSRDAGGRAK